MVHSNHEKYCEDRCHLVSTCAALVSHLDTSVLENSLAIMGFFFCKESPEVDKVPLCQSLGAWFESTLSYFFPRCILSKTLRVEISIFCAGCISESPGGIPLFRNPSAGPLVAWLLQHYLKQMKDFKAG